jgi:heat shock protein HtpX
MRFFEHQHEARTQTSRLLVWFFLTLVAVLLVLNATLALTWRLLTPEGTAYPAHFFATNTAVTLLFVLGGCWLEISALKGGGEKLARRVGAREVRPARHASEQRFANIVSELAIAAHVRAPQPMVLERVSSINAFAAGWDAHDAVIVVTQGALEALNREELQGLVAHELGHLREGDTRLYMRLAGMVAGLEMVFRLGQSLCASRHRGHYTLLAVPGLAIMATGSLGWVAGRLLKAAVSRQREYLADARALQFTRSKNGLGGALRKVAGQGARGGHGEGPDFLPAISHMLLVSPAAKAQWFDAHPPLAERIRRIYGRHMPAVRVVQDEQPTVPAAFG